VGTFRRVALNRIVSVRDFESAESLDEFSRLDGHRYVRVVPPVSHAIGLDAVVRRSPQTLATNSY